MGRELTTDFGGLLIDQPNVSRNSRRIFPRIFCFCVIDENDGQLDNDRPSLFVSTYAANFPGVTFYHQYVNFLAESGYLTLLEPVDNQITFGYSQPRVDGYDWYSRLEGDIGVTLNPTSDIILYCIDESGSMTKSDVQQSLDLFIAKTKDFVTPIFDIYMNPDENMYLPFIREDVLQYLRETLLNLGVPV